MSFIKQFLDYYNPYTENVYGVRILMSTIMGSRRFGSHRRDSDIDFQFVYVRPLADYLGLIGHPPIRYESQFRVADSDELAVPEAPSIVHADGSWPCTRYLKVDAVGFELRDFMCLCSQSNMSASEFLVGSVEGYEDQIAGMLIRAEADRYFQQDLLCRKYVGHVVSAFQRLGKAYDRKEAWMLLRSLAFLYQIRGCGTHQTLDVPTAIRAITARNKDIADAFDAFVTGGELDLKVIDKYVNIVQAWELSVTPTRDIDVAPLDTTTKYLIQNFQPKQ